MASLSYRGQGLPLPLEASIGSPTREPFNKVTVTTEDSEEMAVEGVIDTRRAARTVALQVLYEVDSVGHPWEEVCDRYLTERVSTTEAASFVRDLVEGVLAHREQLDDVISEFAPSWPVEQLPVVDRNLLRLAIYEMTIKKTAPPRVVINETVEMAKLFGNESSFRFVNGVLGSVTEAAKL